MPRQNTDLALLISIHTVQYFLSHRPSLGHLQLHIPYTRHAFEELIELLEELDMRCYLLAIFFVEHKSLEPSECTDIHWSQLDSVLQQPRWNGLHYFIVHRAHLVVPPDRFVFGSQLWGNEDYCEEIVRASTIIREDLMQRLPLMFKRGILEYWSRTDQDTYPV